MVMAISRAYLDIKKRRGGTGGKHTELETSGTRKWFRGDEAMQGRMMDRGKAV